MAKKNAENDGPQYLYVTSARDDNRVVLHEVDDAHPGGSVLVAGDMVRKVGDTALVRAALREADGLVEVDGAEEKKAADRWVADREKAFADAGMTSPSTTAGDRPVVNEGRDPEAEAEAHGDLGPGPLTDPARGGIGSKVTDEEKAAASGDKAPAEKAKG